MDTTLAKPLKQIIQGQSGIYDWVLIVSSILSVLGAGTSSYFGTRLKARAEHDALLKNSEKLDELLAKRTVIQQEALDRVEARKSQLLNEHDALIVVRNKVRAIQKAADIRTGEALLAATRDYFSYVDEMEKLRRTAGIWSAYAGAQNDLRQVEIELQELVAKQGNNDPLTVILGAGGDLINIGVASTGDLYNVISGACSRLYENMVGAGSPDAPANSQPAPSTSTAIPEAKKEAAQALTVYLRAKKSADTLHAGVDACLDEIWKISNVDPVKPVV